MEPRGHSKWGRTVGIAVGCGSLPPPNPHPAEAGLPAELMASGCAEVIVRAERLVECGNQVEEGLAAALVAEGALVLATLALAQSAQRSISPVLPCARQPPVGRPCPGSPAGAEARGLGWG